MKLPRDGLGGSSFTLETTSNFLTAETGDDVPQLGDGRLYICNVGSWGESRQVG